MVKPKPFSFFLSLVLIILLFSNIYSNIGCAQPFIEPVEEQLPTSSSSFSANSNIGILIPKYFTIQRPEWWDITKWGKYPDRVRVTLLDPTNNKKYFIDTELEMIQETDDEWQVYLGELDLKIPAFPEQGPWRVNIVMYTYLLGIQNKVAEITYTGFNVGESSILDNLLAPIYIYIDIMPVKADDDKAIALPGVFYISMLVWIPLVFFAVIIYIRSSYVIGTKLYRKIKKQMKKG